ncbi:hypothetical protein V0288_01405 [Pannus brasiliensis CCIBt3594]|uniref:Uncharacterized protein n=1 Tax=Pannus brasiliensis CCIBt3594 TaxID=1427578 RepID=A0AAW9QF63_9CHRO
MKRFLLGVLSVFFLSTLSIPSTRAATNSGENAPRLEPFYLVHLGYQGYFEKQGIPSNGAFLVGIKSRKVTPITLVQSAIVRGRLSPETLNDRSYLFHVTNLLQLIEPY